MICGAAAKRSPSRRPSIRVRAAAGDDDDLSEADEGAEAGTLGSGSASELKRPRLTAGQVASLEKSFEEENKLEPERKRLLAQMLGLRPRQVAVWFQNRRVRWKTKQMEREYDGLKADFDSLISEYDAVKADYQLLKCDYQDLLLENAHLGAQVKLPAAPWCIVLSHTILGGCLCIAIPVSKGIVTVVPHPAEFFVALPSSAGN